MTHSGLAELNIEITASDATEEDLDRMTRQLLSELRETDVESAELAKGDEVPTGTKSAESVTMGSIMISVLPAVLPMIVELVQAWAARGQGRTVKFKGQVGGWAAAHVGSGSVRRYRKSQACKSPSRKECSNPGRASTRFRSGGHKDPE